ncbi:MAG: hypothetical protein IJK38_03885 [Oscillospiraceae bacterium]|nr:hypothetical protein [Oscillospiraceae bacterium]
MGLFTPKWMSDDQAKALKAVEKITDPRKLAEVAVNAKDQVVVSTAIERIHDEAALAGIALGDAGNFPIEKALERVTNADLLMQIADEAEKDWVRVAALTRLKKQNQKIDLMPYRELIARCVRGGNTDAVSLCTDRFFLYEVYDPSFKPYFMNAKQQSSFKWSIGERINQLELERIRDCRSRSELRRIIDRKDFYYSNKVCKAAQDKLSALLLENASQEEVFKAVLLNPEIIGKALSRLSDPELLGKLARNTLFSPKTRVQIAKKAGIGNPFGRRTLVCPNCGKPAVYREMYESIDSWQTEKGFRCSEYKQGCASSKRDNPLDVFVIGDGDINWKGDLKFICPSCGKLRTSSNASDASAFQKPCDCGCEERPIPVEYQFV